MRAPITMMEWVVILEVVPAMPLDDGDVQRLLCELEEFDPLGIRCDERYALQLRVLGRQPEEAVTTAIRRWRQATERLLLGAGTVVRSEVMTAGELQRDIKATDDGDQLVTAATALHRDPVVLPERAMPAVLSVLAETRD